jgi:hypothetical protein
VLCLDDDAPATPAEVARTMLHGTYAMRDGVQVGSITNRWYDKMQIIVCANGSAGVNFEHTSVDGHTVLRFVSDVFAATIMRFASKISTGMSSRERGQHNPAVKLTRGASCVLDANPTPHHIAWRLTPQLEQAVRFAEVRLSDLVHQVRGPRPAPASAPAAVAGGLPRLHRHHRLPSAGLEDLTPGVRLRASVARRTRRAPSPLTASASAASSSISSHPTPSCSSR